MIRGRVLKFLCAVVLGLALFDNTADAAGCDDSKAAATTCHSCACGPHLISQDVVLVEIAPTPVPYPSYEPIPYTFVLSKSLFRPPCLAA